MTDWAPGPGLAAYHAGVTVICELAARFVDDRWAALTPCPEWRAADLVGHLRCVADDYHEYLDDAPLSRLARLMETGAQPQSLARKLARQNAAELAALADADGREHVAAFAESARAYARRVVNVWNLPHHRYRGTVVTVGGMAGAACAEWHLHAWDLARSLGKDYQPAAPDILVAGWTAGMPHLPLDAGDPLADMPDLSDGGVAAAATGVYAADHAAAEAGWARSVGGRRPAHMGALWARAGHGAGRRAAGPRGSVLARGVTLPCEAGLAGGTFTGTGTTGNRAMAGARAGRGLGGGGAVGSGLAGCAPSGNAGWRALLRASGRLG